MKSRQAIVTGSSSGIGRATALTLASRGWDVLVHCRASVSSANEVADAIRSKGRASDVLVADLGDASAPRLLVEEAWRRAGRLDAWVHLAGVDLLTGDQAKLPYEEKLALMTRVDLLGTAFCCREAARRMKEQGSGSIVTIGWDQSATGMEGDSGEIFAAVKGAIASWTRSAACTWAPSVRLNCVAPGWIKTAWGASASSVWQDRVLSETPMKRWGEPQDVADAIVFLVSDESEFITGQTVNVNGGVVRN